MEPFEQHPNPNSAEPTPPNAIPAKDPVPEAPLTNWDSLRSNPWFCAVAAVLGTGAIGCALMWLSVGVFQSYGAVVFCLSPGICSFLAVILHQWALPVAGTRVWPVTWAVIGVMAVLASMGFLVGTGGEGFICVLMALPFALVMALIGALLGRVVVAFDGRPNPVPVLTMVLFMYPAAQEYEVRHTAPAQPRLVTTQLEVDAAPAQVWAALMQPIDYPAATGLFRAGIVHPTRTAFAQDRATGRRTLVCHYSQGRASLPVVAWEAGRWLTFAVPPAHMPAPMRELSPYPQIHAPHLHGYFQVDSGTFRLRALPGGRTLLEARTTYRHAIGPRAYWEVWSDYLLDAMHARVLATIKTNAEAAHE